MASPRNETVYTLRARVKGGDFSSQTLRALADAEEEWRSQMLKQVEELQQQVTSGDTSPDTLRALADAQETLQQKDKKRDAPNVHLCVDGVDMTSTTAVPIAN